MGGSSTTNTNSSSQSVNEIPQWVQNAGQQNYAFAQDVASQPLQQYQGQLVAGVSPQMQQAWNLAANSGSVGQGAQSAGQAALMSGANYTPQQVGAPTSSQLAGYMNPFTQSVINATLPIMQQNLGLSQDQQQNAANSANAFGGSRQAIQQGVTQAQGAMGMGQMAAQLNQANFAQGMGAAQQANLANQAAGLQGNAQQIAAGRALGTLGGQQMQNNLANYGMLTSAGALEQQQQQNVINAQIAQLAQAQGYPAQQLGVLESALGMTPYNTGTSGSSASTTEQQSNPAAIATGAMQMLGSLFGTLAVQGVALLGALGSSDRRLKTDIVKVGKHHTGDPDLQLPLQGRPQALPEGRRADGRGRRQDRPARRLIHPRLGRQDGGRHARAERARARACRRRGVDRRGVAARSGAASAKGWARAWGRRFLARSRPRASPARSARSARR